MRWGLVLAIAKKELTETLRDRRSLLMLLVLPTLIYPVMLIGLTKVATNQAESREARGSRVGVWGALPPDLERELLAAEPGLQLVAWAGCPAHVQSQLTAGLLAPPPEEPPPPPGGPKKAQLHLGPAEEVARTDDPLAAAARAALAASHETLDAVLVPALDLAARLQADDLGRVVIYHDSVDEDSRQARDRVARGLGEVRERLVDRRIKDRGLPPGFSRGLDVSSRTVALASRRSGQRLGALLPFVLIVMSLMGGFYASIDLTAGEKERGTMQTLLCAPLDPLEVISGKFLTVWAMTMLAGLTNVGSLAATLYRILSADRLEVSPQALGLALLLFVPVSFTTSAVFLAVGAFARDFKDGQNLVTPVYLVLALPTGFTMLPGVELSPWTACVPVLNIALLIKGILVGEAAAELVFLTLGVSAVYGVLALALAARVFHSEQVLLGGHEPLRQTFGLARRPGGAPTPVLALLLFVVVLVALFYGTLLLDDRGIVAIVLGTQVGLMLGPTLLVTGGLGLSWRATLGLRLPPARTLVAAVIVGLSAWTVGAGVFLRFLPPPEDLTEALKRVALLGDPSTPLWLAILVVALVPAICEELLFRGFVLSGLRRLGELPAICCSALLFGLAHASLYRMLPTAFLGLLLGAFAWRTRSVLPGLILHALNNAVAVALVRADGAPPWLKGDGEHVPWSVVLAGTAVLIGGLALLRSAPQAEGEPERA